MRILVLYYSQSGDVRRAAQALVGPLAAATIEWQELRPQSAYPYPWRKLDSFFSVFPACVLQQPPPIEPPAFEPTAAYDLVILAYQVWFLAPSLPFQAFFRTPQAEVLRATPCITLTVCRNMWLTAFQTMRRLIAAAGGRLLDNIVVTHQGPVWATFITTTRALLFGKPKVQGRLLPPAGIANREFQRLARLGRSLAQRLCSQQRAPLRTSLLPDRPAATISRHYLLPELFARWLFRAGARTIVRLEGRAVWLRQAGLYGFMLALLGSIVCLIPAAVAVYGVFHPFVGRRIDAYLSAATACCPS